MPRDPKFAELAAEEYVQKLGIKKLPIDPIDIAENDLKILVTPKPASSKGVSGMLLRVGNEFGISYATHIKSDGFQRFSVAHEIGHYKLPDHIDHVLPPGQNIHESKASFVSNDPYEREADHFAAGLLMPDPLFSEEMIRVGDGLDAIESLSTTCRTSLEATAIRYVERAKIPAAVLRSKGQIIEYCKMSDSLRHLDGIEWIRKGTVVPAGTMTDILNSDPYKVATSKRIDSTTYLSDWFGSEWPIELNEEVKGLGQYGKTLTILSAPEGIDLEEIREEMELDDSLEARFKR
ncbi:MAG: ImmA/IrrE family metallo-endopeptidase [Magnetovibrio sp.]|nr:ImmA/IrrE family metallo-endopeptidase [Magnetovibrio sp.]